MKRIWRRLDQLNRKDENYIEVEDLGHSPSRLVDGFKFYVWN